MNFTDFLCIAIFEIFQIGSINARLKQKTPMFPYLKHLKAIKPSFLTITKLLSNEIGETLCEELK